METSKPEKPDRIRYVRGDDSRFKLIQIETIVRKFRATSKPCTLAQACDLEKDVGWALLDLIEYLQGKDLKASLAMYLISDQKETHPDIMNVEANNICSPTLRAQVRTGVAREFDPDHFRRMAELKLHK